MLLLPFQEFSECSAAMIDALQKQYKRRPRGPKALKKEVDIGLGEGVNVGNPYNERPSSALAHQNAREGLFRALGLSSQLILHLLLPGLFMYVVRPNSKF